MAEQGDGEERSSEDLTDEISTYRLEEYRRRGMVAQSRELTGLAVLLASGAALWAWGPSLGRELMDYMQEVFRTDLSASKNLGDSRVLGQTLMRALRLMAALGIPVAVAGFVLGVIGSFAQIGSIFAVEAISPDFSKVNPLKGIQRLFSGKQLMESFRLLLKMIAVIFVTWLILEEWIPGLSRHLEQEPGQLLEHLGEVGKRMFVALVGTLGLFALVDFGLQKWEYRKGLRMTKQEAKQEFKEREGDPQIKARVRAVQRDMARKRMMDAVKKADAIITNPTHIAIAIVYDKETMAAPKVVAKGADFLAERIKKIATEAGVPLVENVALARTLFKTVKVGKYIPRALYQAVADVLTYVYRLKGRIPGRSGN
jgi:flagellar biosynthetic protein FlhB